MEPSHSSNYICLFITATAHVIVNHNTFANFTNFSTSKKYLFLIKVKVQSLIIELYLYTHSWFHVVFDVARQQCNTK